MEKVPADVYYQAFLSTLSLRRATTFTERTDVQKSDFYPRSPCGERHIVAGQSETGDQISIHALLAESDSCTSIGRPKRLYFYPRSPCGERPSNNESTQIGNSISIHALLAESDSSAAHGLQAPCPISIHALLAESDQVKDTLCQIVDNFYPRSPCGERLTDAINGCNPDFISIHALLAESDVLQS